MLCNRNYVDRCSFKPLLQVQLQTSCTSMCCTFLQQYCCYWATGHSARHACAHWCCLPCSQVHSASDVKPCSSCFCSSFRGPKHQMIQGCRGCCSLAAAIAYTVCTCSLLHLTASVPINCSSHLALLLLWCYGLCCCMLCTGLICLHLACIHIIRSCKAPC